MYRCLHEAPRDCLSRMDIRSSPITCMQFMALIRFTGNLARHCPVTDLVVEGSTVREVLEAACARLPGVRGYILDDQDGLRKHMSAFVDGEQIRDREQLSDFIGPLSTLDIIQALTGG